MQGQIEANQESIQPKVHLVNPTESHSSHQADSSSHSTQQWAKKRRCGDEFFKNHRYSVGLVKPINDPVNVNGLFIHSANRSDDVSGVKMSPQVFKLAGNSAHAVSPFGESISSGLGKADSTNMLQLIKSEELPPVSLKQEEQAPQPKQEAADSSNEQKSD